MGQICQLAELTAQCGEPHCVGQQRTRKGPTARHTMAGMAARSTWKHAFVLTELWPPAPENLCSLGPAPVGTSGPGLRGCAGQVLAPRLGPLYKCREGQNGPCLPGPSPPNYSNKGASPKTILIISASVNREAFQSFIQRAGALCTPLGLFPSTQVLGLTNILVRSPTYLSPEVPQ